ncbi:uncharacterized protein LOC110462874 isoform X1 [Mizuhopecten yessoensis]|uniref:Rhodanese domain-containing protein n=1 Tax=Mizuhopecten yessoensis TaxID=6573 RepID=A0A210PXF3_MIZYE|nr:uncharacterized protein LOC110462874 isoform X1 [Mizuhopecten yessoensis]XP_021372782.1 uncharacterized protein LOC110462874 isoform X2 [Mizuhopecten yessoensis]XP_021372783.1 uncharacterized protein LOC110462874 isoform X1 [Mizuhopecten yessoensis]OWF41142.1 hypothetical protein KP79_PYT16487 [Mizuhopecten yessoensis]
MATGFGMKAVISMMSMKFGSVNDIQTVTLSDWMKDHITHEDQTTKTSSSEPQLQDTSNSRSRRKLVILDCRPEEEYAVSHLEGAIRVDFDKEVNEIVKTLPEHLQPVERLVNTDIVCYCSIGYRSSTVADKLQKYFRKNSGSLPSGPDFPTAVNLEGSLFQWANEGRPMVDSNGQPTSFAHPYNAMWGKLLNAELRKEKL